VRSARGEPSPSKEKGLGHGRAVPGRVKPEIKRVAGGGKFFARGGCSIAKSWRLPGTRKKGVTKNECLIVEKKQVAHSRVVSNETCDTDRAQSRVSTQKLGEGKVWA